MEPHPQPSAGGFYDQTGKSEFLEPDHVNSNPSTYGLCAFHSPVQQAGSQFFLGHHEATYESLQHRRWAMLPKWSPLSLVELRKAQPTPETLMTTETDLYRVPQDFSVFCLYTLLSFSVI